MNGLCVFFQLEAMKHWNSIIQTRIELICKECLPKLKKTIIYQIEPCFKNFVLAEVVSELSALDIDPLALAICFNVTPEDALRIIKSYENSTSSSELLLLELLKTAREHSRNDLCHWLELHLERFVEYNNKIVEGIKSCPKTQLRERRREQRKYRTSVVAWEKEEKNAALACRTKREIDDAEKMPSNSKAQ